MAMPGKKPMKPCKATCGCVPFSLDCRMSMERGRMLCKRCPHRLRGIFNHGKTRYELIRLN